MTRLLSLDCSTWWGSVALLEAEGDDPRVVAEIGVGMRESHASHLIGWIGRLLDVAGWSRSQLDLFVGTRGPGSFTGIRVGLGTLEGLALASDRPAVGVVTLDALAEAHGPACGPRRALIAAGRGEFYTSRYEAAASPARPVDSPRLIAAALLAQVDDAAGAVWIPAPGSRESLSEPCAARRETLLAGEPRAIAAAAGRVALLGGAPAEQPAVPLAPLYVRLPDAELKRRPGS